MTIVSSGARVWARTDESASRSMAARLYTGMTTEMLITIGPKALSSSWIRRHENNKGAALDSYACAFHAPGVTRTPGQRFRKPLLYPPELQGQHW
jgi:hypothetical protein